MRGYSHFARYCLPDRQQNNQTTKQPDNKTTYHYIFLFIDILFLSQATKQLNNKTTILNIDIFALPHGSGDWEEGGIIAYEKLSQKL